MQMLVSVKNPYDSPGLIVVAIASEPHQVGSDLGEALLPRIQVERKGCELIDQRHRLRVGRDVDVEQVAAAGLTSIDPDVGKDRQRAIAVIRRQPTYDASALT